MDVKLNYRKRSTKQDGMMGEIKVIIAFHIGALQAEMSIASVEKMCHLVKTKAGKDVGA